MKLIFSKQLTVVSFVIAALFVVTVSIGWGAVRCWNTGKDLDAVVLLLGFLLCVDLIRTSINNLWQMIKTERLKNALKR